MRIAVLPLDSRPPNLHFPARLGSITHIETVLPPADKLGTLHQPAVRSWLLDWLSGMARESAAAVISWDALVYGGLVQSRSDQPEPLPLPEIETALTGIDWQRCAGYLYVVIPRLGMTVTDARSWEQHRDLAAFFVAWAELNADPTGDGAAARLKELEQSLGADLVARAWSLRRRNFEYARAAIELASRLGLRGCHIAVEDNAPVGPHLHELAELRRIAGAARDASARESSDTPPRYTFFDGADECAALLTARAILDVTKSPPQPVRLSLFPSAPGPDRYIGLYESQTLEAGLDFLSRYLDLPFRQQAGAQWLVCYGKQPQPDAFAAGPAVYNNPYLLPTGIDGDEPLHVADLAACNGGNPHLAIRLGELAGTRLRSVSAWNTNFNALGFSAATLAVSGLTNADREAQRELLLERLADDYVYQSIARAEVIQRCGMLRLNPLDFSDASEGAVTMLEHVCRETWRAWANGPAAELLRNSGITTEQCHSLRYSFPWMRAFETEVTLG